jgi:hypothetical protein
VTSIIRKPIIGIQCHRRSEEKPNIKRFTQRGACMKHLLNLVCVATLAACATQSGPGGWGYEPGQGAPSVISESEATQYTEDVISLRAQRDSLRTNLPNVRDPATRANHIRSIDTLSENIRMLEYRLRAAGRPLP